MKRESEIRPSPCAQHFDVAQAGAGGAVVGAGLGAAVTGGAVGAGAAAAGAPADDPPDDGAAAGPALRDGAAATEDPPGDAAPATGAGDPATDPARWTGAAPDPDPAVAAAAPPAVAVPVGAPGGTVSPGASSTGTGRWISCTTIVVTGTAVVVGASVSPATCSEPPDGPAGGADAAALMMDTRPMTAVPLTPATATRLAEAA